MLYLHLILLLIRSDLLLNPNYGRSAVGVERPIVICSYCFKEKGLSCHAAEKWKAEPPGFLCGPSIYPGDAFLSQTTENTPSLTLGGRVNLSPLDKVGRVVHILGFVETRDPTKSNTYDDHLSATKTFMI